MDIKVFFMRSQAAAHVEQNPCLRIQHPQPLVGQPALSFTWQTIGVRLIA
jgi:hypothetical protein